MSDLRRLAEQAVVYDPPWDLVAYDLSPVAREWVLAANPTVVLGLLDQNDRLRSAVKAVRDKIEARLTERVVGNYTQGAVSEQADWMAEGWSAARTAVLAILDHELEYGSLRGSGAEEAARDE